jgi:hypothetical protein
MRPAVFVASMVLVASLHRHRLRTLSRRDWPAGHHGRGAGSTASPRPFPCDQVGWCFITRSGPQATCAARPYRTGGGKHFRLERALNLPQSLTNKAIEELRKKRNELVAEFQVATPQTTDSSRVSRVVMTPNLLGLQWNQVLLYPAGYAARDIQVRASVQLPAGWKHAGAAPTLAR